MKSFHSGVICPQNPKLGEGQRGTSLRAGYWSRDASKRDIVAQFSDFGLFSLYKTSKTYLPVNSTRIGYKKYYIIRHNMGTAAILIFDKCLSPRQTTANICKTAFSLHVVESASDDYNF